MNSCCRGNSSLLNSCQSMGSVSHCLPEPRDPDKLSQQEYSKKLISRDTLLIFKSRLSQELDTGKEFHHQHPCIYSNFPQVGGLLQKIMWVVPYQALLFLLQVYFDLPISHSFCFILVPPRYVVF